MSDDHDHPVVMSLFCSDSEHCKYCKNIAAVIIIVQKPQCSDTGCQVMRDCSSITSTLYRDEEREGDKDHVLALLFSF